MRPDSPINPPNICVGQRHEQTYPASDDTQVQGADTGPGAREGVGMVSKTERNDVRLQEVPSLSASLCQWEQGLSP